MGGSHRIIHGFALHFGCLKPTSPETIFTFPNCFSFDLDFLILDGQLVVGMPAKRVRAALQEKCPSPGGKHALRKGAGSTMSKNDTLLIAKAKKLLSSLSKVIASVPNKENATTLFAKLKVG
jgi:hypothetical protein